MQLNLNEVMVGFWLKNHWDCTNTNGSHAGLGLDDLPRCRLVVGEELPVRHDVGRTAAVQHEPWWHALVKNKSFFWLKFEKHQIFTVRFGLKIARWFTAILTAKIFGMVS